MKEALKLALDALESGVKTTANRISWTEYDSCLINEALTAIKEALALTSTPCEVQPEQEPQVRTGDCLRVGVCASEGHKIQAQRPWGKPWVSLTDDEYDEIWRMDLNNKDIMDKTITKLRELNT